MKKYKNKYRIESTRLQNWDYGANAPYFVTICTKYRVHYFGEISDREMNLSKIGILADKYWYEIPEHFPFVKLGEFTVMPNHIHGIIEIAKTNNNVVVVEQPNLGGSTTDNPPQTHNASKKWKPATLGVIINQYKRIVTIEARNINPGFQWQSRFYDHIIRNEKSFQRISEYIKNNPLNWKEDKFYKKK